jgi:hypothetical protein
MRLSKRLYPYAPFAALVVVAVLGCVSEDRRSDPSRTVLSAAPASPVVQDQGRGVLIEADRQMKDLKQLRDDATDPFMREAMTRQFEDLGARSERLLDDMTISDGRVHDATIRVDVANLQRSMSATANAEKQAQPEADSPGTLP